MSNYDAQKVVAAPLLALARKHRFALAITYSLFGLESVTAVAQPFVLGLAIDGLLASSWYGLAIFVAQQLSVLILGAIRRIYDTRLFTRIASDLETRLVINQRRSGVAVSHISARVVLSRQIVDFFERDLQFLFHFAVQGIGAVSMLALVAPALLPYCLVAVVVASVFGISYGRFARLWTKGLHDEMERTVSVIAESGKAEINHHFRQLALWKVRFSDGEAFFFGAWQLVALILTSLVIVRTGAAIQDAGKILAVIGYVQMLLTTLVNIPRIADQVTKLYDSCRRMYAETKADTCNELHSSAV